MVSQALVISTTKYRDHDLIANCLIKEQGMQSFLLRGVLKSKKCAIRPAYFQPLMQLEVEIATNKTTEKKMGYLKSVRVSHPYQNLHNDPIKQSILFFIAELLQKLVQAEQAPNENFFDYITTALKWLDLNENTAHFHLVFMIKLTRYIGFYPSTENIDDPFFDAYGGRFKTRKMGAYCWDENETKDFKKLLECDFESPVHLITQKNTLTNLLCDYFKLHLQGFQTPKSLAVLKVLLR